MMNVYRKDTISGAYRLSSKPNILKKVKAEESPQKPNQSEAENATDGVTKQVAKANTLGAPAEAGTSPAFIKERNSPYVLVENDEKNQLGRPTQVVIDGNHLENLDTLKKQLTPVTDNKSQQQMSFIGETARHDDVTDSPKTIDILNTTDNLKSVTGKETLVPKKTQDANTSIGPKELAYLTERGEQHNSSSNFPQRGSQKMQPGSHRLSKEGSTENQAYNAMFD